MPMLWIIATVCATAAAVCLYYGFFIEVNQLSKEELRLEIPDLPDFWQGRRLVFISDLHLGAGMPPERFQAFLQACQMEHPDLLLIGGDVWEKAGQHGWDAHHRLWFQTLADLKPPLGTYAVYGNHDLESPLALERCQLLAAAASIRYFRNDGLMLHGIYLGGLEDAIHGHPDLAAALKNKTDPAAFELLLFHEPDPAALLEPAAGSRLCLSGHSHDGQIKPFGLHLYRERMGWRYPRGLAALRPDQWLYTSSGLGTVRIHARFAAKPSFLLLTLEKKRPMSMGHITRHKVCAAYSDRG